MISPRDCALPCMNVAKFWQKTFRELTTIPMRSAIRSLSKIKVTPVLTFAYQARVCANDGKVDQSIITRSDDAHDPRSDNQLTHGSLY